MAELTKTDNRQPMGKIKPTDKMVMMPSLFGGTKPATSKQHYKRFNLYIIYIKDITTLKMMFLQRYNPWGKTKREQLQLWNILSFDPKNTDVDEHIDLINTLGDMVDQKEETKMEKFIETMPTMIQTHLITCKDLATVKDTAKSFKHIMRKCDPPTPAKDLSILNVSFRIIDIREAHPNRTVLITAITVNPIFKGIKQITTEAEAEAEAMAVAMVLSILDDAVMVGPIIRIATEHISISITCMIHNQNNMALPAVYAVVLIILLSIVTRENMI